MSNIKTRRTVIQLPIRIRGFLFMLQHVVASDFPPIPADPIPVKFDPVRHVVVLSAPAPELVREAVHFDHLIFCQGTDSSKNVPVWQPGAWERRKCETGNRNNSKKEASDLPIIHCVDSNRHVTRLIGTSVPVFCCFVSRRERGMFCFEKVMATACVATRMSEPKVQPSGTAIV